MFTTMPRSLLALKDRYGKSKSEELSSEDQDVDVEGKSYFVSSTSFITIVVGFHELTIAEYFAEFWLIFVQ